MTRSDTTQVRGGPILLDEASSNIFWFAGACALTIAGTRAYLEWTGYPQVGGAVYHIAHALWGGLLLTVAALLAVTLANRWVPRLTAIMGGAGAGLFVDEVGKFITKKNDYFFPLAATIIYLFLVLLALASVTVSRIAGNSPRAHIRAAARLLAEASDGRLDTASHARFVAHLQAARAGDLSEDQRQVVAAMTLIADIPARPGEVRLPLQERLAHRLGAVALRRITRTLLLVQALIGLALLIAGMVSTQVHVEFLPADINGVRVGSLAETLTIASMVVTVIAGALAFSAYRAMKPKRLNVPRALRRGSISLILLLAVANTLGAYTSQFETLTDAALQVLTLGSLHLWGRAQDGAYESAQEASA